MRFYHIFLLIGILLCIGKIAYACPPDMNSVGAVLNNGEHVSYEKIETYGSLGVNYLKDFIAPVAAVSDTFLQRSLNKKHTSGIFSLISQSFVYDPTATSSFSVKPLFSFNNDTLILNDYWALSEQPAFRCSLSVSNDTLYISYLPITGPVNDWTPSVETTLKIQTHAFVIDTVYKSLNLCFKAVPYARPATEIGFRDATKDFYAFLPIPPLATYKYRAHSDSSVMVYLGYERNSDTYRFSPRICISSDTAENQAGKDLFAILADELQWLSSAHIISLGAGFINGLTAKAPDRGGLCYWSKQDSTISLNQWFLINGGAMVVFGMRNGCGLGTEFDLPAHTLAASASVSDMHSSYHAKAALTYVTVKRGVLDIVSQTVFDAVRVVNPLGRTVFSRAMGSPLVRAMVPLSGRTGACSPGIYFLVLAKERRIIYCQQLPQ